MLFAVLFTLSVLLTIGCIGYIIYYLRQERTRDAQIFWLILAALIIVDVVLYEQARIENFRNRIVAITKIHFEESRFIIKEGELFECRYGENWLWIIKMSDSQILVAVDDVTAIYPYNRVAIDVDRRTVLINKAISEGVVESSKGIVLTRCLDDKNKNLTIRVSRKWYRLSYMQKKAIVYEYESLSQSLLFTKPFIAPLEERFVTKFYDESGRLVATFVPLDNPMWQKVTIYH